MVLDGAGAPSARGAPGPAGLVVGGGTMILPDSSGVVAFAQQQAQAARVEAMAHSAQKAAPTPWVFWAAWAVLGVGAGLALHFVQLQQQLGG